MMMKVSFLLMVLCLSCFAEYTMAQESKVAVKEEWWQKEARETRERVIKERKPGSLSPDFECSDIHGNKVSLKNFRGKYVYLDIWGTGCAPCRKEIPFLEELEKKMKGKKIVFVSISTDRKRAAWEKMVREKNMKGVQLYMGKDELFTKAYGIDCIPRFILLDKKGRVVNPYMTRPSDPATYKYLQGLKGL